MSLSYIDPLVLRKAIRSGLRMEQEVREIIGYGGYAGGDDESKVRIKKISQDV